VVNGTCTEPTPVLAIGYPGDACKVASDCVTKSCSITGKCAGAQLGASCLTIGCDYGLQCDANTDFTCKSQLAAQSTGCDSDYSCVNNAGCNKTLTTLSGRCLPYFSVEVGQVVSCDSLDGYDVNFLCKSGAAVTEDAKQGTCTCIDAPKSINPPPYKCSASQECLGQSSSTNKVYQSECSCGYNKNGDKYCQPFLGDKVGVEYLNELMPLYGNDLTIF